MTTMTVVSGMAPILTNTICVISSMSSTISDISCCCALTTFTSYLFCASMVLVLVLLLVADKSDLYPILRGGWT